MNFFLVIDDFGNYVQSEPIRPQSWSGRMLFFLIMAGLITVLVMIFRGLILSFVFMFRYNRISVTLFGMLNSVVMLGVNEVFLYILEADRVVVFIVDLIAFAILSWTEGRYYKVDGSTVFNPFISSLMVNYFSAVLGFFVFRYLSTIVI